MTTPEIPLYQKSLAEVLYLLGGDKNISPDLAAIFREEGKDDLQPAIPERRD